MEKKLKWDFQSCVVWETFTPTLTESRESPAFSCRGRECYLTLDFGKENAEYDPENYYFLNLRLRNDKQLFSGITAIALLECQGRILLTDYYWVWYSGGNLWRMNETVLLKQAPCLRNRKQVWRFRVIFTNNTDLVNLEVENYPIFGVCENNSEAKSVQTPLYLNPDPCLESLSEDLAYLLDDGSHCDVELKCENHTIKAHKVVLSSRSEVFKKMLQSDMAEGLTGVVEIQDMDYGALVDFIRYLYSGKLPGLTTDTAIRLYEVGDKYAVEKLVERCGSFLIENMTPENACPLLLLADAHNDPEFKDAVIVYILDQKMFLQDDPWCSFCDKHPNLAIEVMNRFARSDLPGRHNTRKLVKFSSEFFENSEFQI